MSDQKLPPKPGPDVSGEAQMKAAFVREFPESKGEFFAVRAPGRVNLIGEHTDYNDGFVLPMAIDRHVTMLCRARPDATVRIHSVAESQTAEFNISQTIAKGPPRWSLYAKGVAEALRVKGLVKRGMDAVLQSTVPIGGGLSSSAAFEVATGLALLKANDAVLPPKDLALECQWAEHHYPGMPSGIMDQFICALGRAGHAMLLDCRDYSTKFLPLDDPALRIVIANSNVKHELVQGEYTARRRQCEAAVAALKKKFPNVKMLRDVTVGMLEDCRLGMDPTVFKRAHHVITENQRTQEFAAALERRDYAACGQFMYGSHASLRDEYGVSCPELDTLVDLSKPVPGVFGARMTGGGFGGCIVVLAMESAVGALEKVLTTEYPRLYKKNPTIFATVASAGAGPLPV